GAEARRTAALGAVSFYLRPNPIGGRNLYHRGHFPLWAEIERLGKPVCLHDSGSPHLPSYGDRMDTHTTGHILAHPFEAMGAMMSLIWYGVFEHFPHLTVVHVEADAGWVPYLLQRMEQHWEFSGNAEHPDLKMRPTEYFRRNVFVPGTVVVVVPRLLSGWRIQPPLFGWAPVRWIGLVLVLLAFPLFLDFLVGFVRRGHGTPAPIAPPERLVVSGGFRYVRNPGYIAVVSMVVGQGLFLGSKAILVYAACLALGFHLFVVLYEE